MILPIEIEKYSRKMKTTTHTIWTPKALQVMVQARTKQFEQNSETFMDFNCWKTTQGI